MLMCLMWYNIRLFYNCREESKQLILNIIDCIVTLGNN